jgi:hypothetical protein
LCAHDPGRHSPILSKLQDLRILHSKQGQLGLESKHLCSYKHSLATEQRQTDCASGRSVGLHPDSPKFRLLFWAPSTLLAHVEMMEESLRCLRMNQTSITSIAVLCKAGSFFESMIQEPDVSGRTRGK